MALHTKTVNMAKGLDHEEPAPEPFSQNRRPETGRFRLQVDRQTKASFTTYEAAEQAGMVIKKAHPVVRVAVYDAATSINRILDLPEAK